MKKFLPIFIVGLIFAPATLWAAESQDDARSVATMEEVVVTATRTATNLDKVGGSAVTVITAEEIEKKQPATVAEMLRTVPGLDVKSNGGRGTNTSIHLRGADNKNTLVLVDGIMYNDPSQANRGANIGSLTMDNVERIEIVRGPMSVLYGSNATAGVVNIITRKGRGKPTVSGGAEGGSYDTWKVFGDSSGSNRKFDYSVSAAHTESGGFSIADDDNDRIPHAGNTSEDDGWENTTLSARLGFAVTPDFKIDTVIRHLDSTVELDDYNGSYAGDRFASWFAPTPNAPEPDGLKERRTESEQLFARINFHNSFLNGRLSSDLALQSARQDRDSFDNDGLPSYDFTGENREATWQGSVRIMESNLVSVGAGVIREEMNSDANAIVDKTAETLSVWGQDQIMIGEALDIVAGLRYDDHDRFGGKATYRLAPAYYLDATSTTFKAGYGTGFRAPSLYELFSFYGNETLGAEESEGWDLGVEQRLLAGRLSLGLTYFALNFDDRIDYDFALSQYAQQDGVTRTRGVETAAKFAATDSLDLGLTYTYTDTKDPDGARLVRRPLNKASIYATYYFGEKGSINCDLIWVDERDASPFAADGSGNPVGTLDSYALVNLAGRYLVAENLELYAKVDNLFDEYYEEAWSYATPGLSGYLGVRVKY
ncbi:MAG: TonB-dependent receptor [Desulfurivibrionaceae bacterium]